MDPLNISQGIEIEGEPGAQIKGPVTIIGGEGGVFRGTTPITHKLLGMPSQP